MQNEHDRNETTGSRRKAVSGAEVEQHRLVKRVKLEEDLDIEVQSLLSLPAPSAADGVSVSAPGAVSEGRPHGRPGKRKRGPRKTCMTREQREQELLKDGRISAVEARQVLCRMCGRWIKLCRQSDFVMQNWNTHAVRCQERTGWLTKVKREPENTFDLTVATQPEPPTAEEKLDEAIIKEEEGISVRRSNRGLTVEDRKHILEADQRVKRVERHLVQCAMCDREVKLHNFRSYELWNWTQHAKKCEARLGRRAGPLSDATTNGTTLVDETTVESDTEVEAALVAPSPSVQTPEEESSHYRNVQAALPKITLRPSYYRNAPSADEVDNSKADSSAVPIPTTSSTRVKREPSDYLPDGGSIPMPPVSSAAPDLLPFTSVSAPVPRKPSPSVKFSSFSVRLAGTRHNKKGRNEEERRMALEVDTRCSEVRPHEVFCLLCKRWIKLYRDVTYIDSNWLRHAERCELRNGVLPRKKRRLTSPPVDVKPIPVEAAPVEDAVAESSQAATRRMQELQDDSRITKVEAHQVLCGVCKQWIKLQPYREYDTWNWRKHIPNCEERQRQGEVSVVQDSCDPSPMLSPGKQAASAAITDIETVEGRKKVLEEDGRCTEVEAHRVLCLMCKRHIGLHANKDYSLANWYKHTQACSKKLGLTNLTQSAPPIPRQRAEAPSATESISAAPRRARVVAQDDDIVEISRKEAEASVTALTEGELSSPGKTGADLRRDNMLKDPRIGALEPTRVFCKSCNSWLKLSNQIPYTAYNWHKHADRCEEKRKARDEALLTVVVKAQSPEIVLLDGPPLTAPPTVRRRKGRARKTLEERLARMSADDRIKVLEPHRVQCSFCDRWVKLQAKVEYDSTNWDTHVARCALKSRPVANPEPMLTQVNKIASPQKRLVYPMVDMKSSPIKLPFLNAEGRREALLSDSRAAAVEAHRVQCALCQQWIKLKEDKAFFGHNFYKHADRCERKNNASDTPANDSSAVVLNGADITVKMEEDFGTALNGSGTPKSKNEARLAELLADPRQGGVERGRVLCKMCNNWIKLNSSNSFLPGNWRRHASRCQKSSNWQGPTLAETSAVDPQSVEIIDLEIEDEEGPVDLSLFGFVELGRLVNAFEPSVSSTEFAIRPSDLPKEKMKKLPIPLPIVRNLRARMSSASVTPKPEEPLSISAGKRSHRTEIHRKEELERDPRARIVLAEKILCAMCDKWIQMRRDISYSSQNWLKHAESCQNRLGFMKKLDRASQTPEMIAQEQEEEEILPYNAKNCVATDEVELANDVPSFKPVDWQQEVVASDGEDEDDYPISPGVYIPETPTEYVPLERREERMQSVIVKQEPTEILDLTLTSSKEKASGAAPTPLTFLHLRKPSNGDQNASLGVKVEPDPKKGRKSTSKSPPTINPFTTTPLSRPLTTFAPPIIAPLPGQSISEFATANHAENNAGANHPYSSGPSFALQPSTVLKPESPFMEVLTPQQPLTTMPRASFGSVTYGRLLIPPGAHSPVSADHPYLYQGMPYYPVAQPSRQQPAAVNTQNRTIRPNGPPTPISAVLGPRPPVVLPHTTLRPSQHSPAAAAAAVQLTPYPNIQYRTIDPNPTIPSIPSPLTTIMRDRPPMSFTSQLSPISVSHNRFIHTPPFPSPHFESPADRR